jgi:hypothetical protein
MGWEIRLDDVIDLASGIPRAPDLDRHFVGTDQLGREGSFGPRPAYGNLERLSSGHGVVAPNRQV